MLSSSEVLYFIFFVFKKIFIYVFKNIKATFIYIM